MSNSGLGFDFAIFRRAANQAKAISSEDEAPCIDYRRDETEHRGVLHSCSIGFAPIYDLKAITALSQIRKTEFVQLKQQLQLQPSSTNCLIM